MRTPMELFAAAGALALGLAAVPAVTAGPWPAADEEDVAFTASNGLSSTYHVYAEGVPAPAGLLIWTHGDGAYEYHNPDSDYVMGGPQGVRALAKDEGYVVVSALAPDRDGTTTWWEDGEANATYLADLLTHLRGEYDIDPDDVVLAGFSGGAQFTTMYFLPAYSHLLTGGGTVVFGGGGPPYEDAQFDEALKPRFDMHWATGALDDLEHSDEGYDALCYAREGVAYYSAAGFSTSYQWIPGRDHVIDGLFGGIVAERLRAMDTAEPGGPGSPGSPGSPGGPAPRSAGEVADATGWPVRVEFDPVGYAFLTVDAPPGTPGPATVRVDGTDGTYWYQIKPLDQGTEFRMGDPCDYLSDLTTYTYRVSTGGVTRATGTFTTPEFTGPVDPVDPVDPVAPTPVVVEPPRISGTARMGHTLRATTGHWEVEPGAEAALTYAVQWLRDGTPISGATDAEYRISGADRGTRLSVEVTATATGEGGAGTAVARSAEVAVTVPAVVTGRTSPVFASTRSPVTVEVTVRGIGSTVTPTGDVEVDVAGARHFGALVDGRATIRVDALPRGIHLVRATYAGDELVRPATGWAGIVLVL